MNCEMCGKEENLVVVLIEGVEMNVCRACASFGKILRRVVVEKPKSKKEEKEKEEEAEVIQVIVGSYAKKIKEKREGMGLTQEEFAKKIKEKESLVHNMEAGKFKPSIVLAQKIERFLGIKLVEEYKEEHIVKKLEAGEGMTIGDLIKKKS